MKIISWDIGIKNLAYCILEISENTNNSFEILEWDKINLLESNKTCHGFISENNLKCENKCEYEYKLYDNTYYFCALHKNQYIKILEKQEKLLNNTEQNLECFCENVIKKNGIVCNKQSIINYNNCNYCQTHYNSLKKKFNRNIVKITQNANKTPIEEIKFNLIKKLDNLPNILDIDKVLIENQPALKNPKMKAIADTLYTWFLIRGIIDKSIIKNILYISPSNKLKINKDNTLTILSNSKNDVEKYKLTKELAIQYCHQIISDNDKYKNIFNSFKKKDDLADALLQGLYYIKILSKIN